MTQVKLVRLCALLVLRSISSAAEQPVAKPATAFTVSLNHGFRAGDCPDERCVNQWLAVSVDGSGRLTIETYRQPSRSTSPAPVNPEVLVVEKIYNVPPDTNDLRKLGNLVKVIDPTLKSTEDQVCPHIVVQSDPGRFQIEQCAPTPVKSPIHRIEILTRALIDAAERGRAVETNTRVRPAS